MGLVVKSPTSYQYQLEFCDRSDKKDDDFVFEQDGVLFYVTGDGLEQLRGTSLDYVDTGFSAGFKFDNPNKPKLLSDPIAERVHRLLELGAPEPAVRRWPGWLRVTVHLSLLAAALLALPGIHAAAEHVLRWGL